MSAPAAAAAGRFVGQSVRRVEDVRLVTGHGRYVDDIDVPQGTLHIAFVRSPVARGTLGEVDATEARALEGVVAVLTAADLNPMFNKHNYWFTIMGPPADPSADNQWRLMAEGDVRYVGEPIAMVLATSRAIAEDGVDLVEFDIDALPPVMDSDAALAEGAAIVHPELGTNVASEIPAFPNPEVERILATAPHVVTETIIQHRYIPVPMECRGIVAEWDPFREHLEMTFSSQGAHEIGAVASRVFGIRSDRIHAQQGDVGGSFGQKMFPGREELAVIAATYKLGVPVKWIEDRSENLVAGGHARVEKATATIAADDSGKILAMRVDHVDDIGSYGGGSSSALSLATITGPYDIPNVEYRARGVYTNTGGKVAYRGPWMFESVLREQMVDLLAQEMGMDAMEIRLRNVVPLDQQPWTMWSQMPVGFVSTQECLEQVRDNLGYAELRAEQERLRAEGRYIGIGIGAYVEPNQGFGALGNEQVTVRIDPLGKVTVYSGAGNHGQGIETTMAQVVAEQLGCDIADVTVLQGTSDAGYSVGTGGSRTAPIFNAAAHNAADLLRAKVIQIASQMLEAPPSGLVVENGVVSFADNPGQSVTFEQVAGMAYGGHAMLPAGVEPGLEVSFRISAPPAIWSNATHGAVVEVDITTGEVEIVRYVVSEDCGNMINPAIVAGQMYGGVAQGIGGVFYENFVYDADGNPLTTTFLDYALPTASDIPKIEIDHVTTPSDTPGGYKGMGEGGAMISPSTLINAVRDALLPLGVRINSQPLGPSQIMAALREAGH